MCLLLYSVLFGMNTSQELLEENEEDTALNIPTTDIEEEESIIEFISSNSVGDNELVLVEKQKAKLECFWLQT